jgi:hypothetical protein
VLHWWKLTDVLHGFLVDDCTNYSMESKLLLGREWPSEGERSSFISSCFTMGVLAVCMVTVILAMVSSSVSTYVALIQDSDSVISKLAIFMPVNCLKTNPTPAFQDAKIRNLV